jgi:glutamate-1-semialdehyde 2,1-aminomutase
VRGSWEPLGVRPDLSAYSKAIANGYALAAVTGVDSLREAGAAVFSTGSFWFAAAAMAAAVATITELRDGTGLADMKAAGQQLREGLAAQAQASGLVVHQTGPVQMPFLRFDEDPTYARVNRWCSETIHHGVYLHPWHNWFLSAAHTSADIDEVLEVTGRSFEVVAGT